MARATKKATDTKTVGEERFEAARRHIVKLRKLEHEQQSRFNELHDWSRAGRAFHDADRRPRTPEEREELKALEGAYIDAQTRVFLHKQDGREL